MGHRDNDLLLPCFANRRLQQRQRPLSLSLCHSVYSTQYNIFHTNKFALCHIYTNMTFRLFTHIAPRGSLEHIHICVPSSQSGKLPPGLQSSGSSHFSSGGTCFPTTKDRGLLYRTSVVKHLVGFTDADWSANFGDRRSTSRFTFALGSATIAWSSKKQPTIMLSIMEAKYRGMVVATWLKSLLNDQQIEVSDLMKIYCDNLSNIQLAWNPIFHAWTKHIQVH